MEYLIKTSAIGGMTEEQFFNFCQENGSIQFERTALGDIILMEPTGSETERFNLDIAVDLANWNRKAGLGYVFGNNGGFTLPNKAVRSPDAAFIARNRYDALPQSDREKFAHICPDYVIEILSDNDQERILQQKMEEWMMNGCRLAWLINPKRKVTLIYRPDEEPEARAFGTPLDGEDVLPAFTLDPGKFF